MEDLVNNMLSVIISINGKPITGRSCYRTSEKTKNGASIYLCDDGRKIKHLYGKGAVKLAIKLLKGIKA